MLEDVLYKHHGRRPNENHEQSKDVYNNTLVMLEAIFGLPTPSRTEQEDLPLELQRESHYNIEQLQRCVEENDFHHNTGVC